jgi:hypothetical protein
MNRSCWTWAVGCAIGLGAALGGCQPSNQVKPGSPVMLSFGPVDPTGAPVDLSGATGAATVPPLSHFVAIFDRILDPTPLEDPGPDGGAKAGVASFQYAGGPVGVTTNYVPDGDSQFFLEFAPGPSLTVFSNPPGLPSASAVMVGLDTQDLRSHDQKSPVMLAPGVVAGFMFTTDPLSVTTDVPAPVPPVTDDGGAAGDDGGTDAGAPGGAVDPSLDPGLIVNVSFNDATPPTTISHIQVSGTQGGVPIVDLAAVVAQDPNDASHWTVAPPGTVPPDTVGAWPPGAVITITIDAGATDTFGMPLGAPVSASFPVKMVTP